VGAISKAQAALRRGRPGPAADPQEARQRLNRALKRIDRLDARVAELEHSLHEERQLQRRVAELTDVVSELLVPAMDRDDERVRGALDRLDPPG